MNNWKTIFLFMIAGLLIYEVYKNVQQDDYRKSFKGETIAFIFIQIEKF